MEKETADHLPEKLVVDLPVLYKQLIRRFDPTLGESTR
jgi:hypothetical protein